MSTMNISLPEALKAFFDAQVAERGYGTSSEYVRELIRKGQECQHLRGILLAGAESSVGPPADTAYFGPPHAGTRGDVAASVMAAPVVLRTAVSRRSSVDVDVSALRDLTDAFARVVHHQQRPVDVSTSSVSATQLSVARAGS